MPNSAKEIQAVLQLSNVSKNFGGVVAAKDICVELYRGEVFGLIGPNGAGKTTLLNLITGIYMADQGEVYLDGQKITKLPTHKRAKMGIARTFQHPRLLNRCDIKTNIFMGVDLAARKNKRNKNVEQELSTLLTCAGLDRVNLADKVNQLSYGQQKMLEIVRAILCEPAVLLLDEPAAGLNHKEMDYVVALIEMAVEKNIAVLLIEHAMDLVMSVCDRITVLNFGCQIATGESEEIQKNEAVIEAYLGGGANAED